MNGLNKCYLCNGIYVIINYTCDKKIEYNRTKKLDSIFNEKYNDFDLGNIIEIIRTIFSDCKEKTLRVTIVYHDDITNLVYLSNGKIVKYIKKIKYNDNYLDILYTKKKGLMIKSLENTVMMGNIINGEINKMNHLEDITAIKLKTSDKVLYEIYRLFYRNTPNFMDNNDRIRAQVMMFILNEYGISLEDDVFYLVKDYSKSLKINESMNRLMIANNISKVEVRDCYKKNIINIGKILWDCNTDELIDFAKYVYISKYRDKNYVNDSAYRLVKKINRSNSN